ncbi:hypothetical protein K505DRAFT_328593 [Melanomma pulvis-pyrius CBS 109.77]|uniref:Uncharacterized protein n=1 Tax=Melanomma pulvis-pyrius CBS 109.77 TaxID=1314802 RepID=A0A6A6WYH0_9PLEO|nr:hypothetical protein K505DRAFT_328593 [Melanomma pulvis-pyrius CBS 109.77]
MDDKTRQRPNLHNGRRESHHLRERRRNPNPLPHSTKAASPARSYRATHCPPIPQQSSPQTPTTKRALQDQAPQPT